MENFIFSAVKVLVKNVQIQVMQNKSTAQNCDKTLGKFRIEF